MAEEAAMRVGHQPAARACAAAIRTLLAAADSLDDDGLPAPSRCPVCSRVNALVHGNLGLQEMLLGVVSPTEAGRTWMRRAT